MKSRLANALWVASCLPEWQRFTRSAENVAETQARLLADNLRVNADTEYGSRYGFAAIATPQQYQARVPLSSYDDYTGFIERIGNGLPAVLAADPVRVFELSSGSTAPSKLIPYTARLQAEFQRGIAPWIFDLYTHYPKIQGGTAYWSITPLTSGQRRTLAGLPIGFESDSAYLSPFSQWLVNIIMAVPDRVKYLPSIDSFRYVTLLSLLHQPDLRLISVWNPTFLTLLLAPLADWWDLLLGDIAAGTVSLPAGNFHTGIRFPPDPRLAHRLKNIHPADYGALWPNLALISCWADGPSAPYARQLARQFPRAQIQGKGLLATEAFVSLPLANQEGAALSVDSHFFEFIDSRGEILLGHQLQRGQSYQVVVTTGGGLYRYQLHDIVETVGFWKQLPLLRFMGKSDHISDWFGEKLEEHFVAGALRKVFLMHDVDAAFAMLVPDDRPPGFRYVLYLETPSRAGSSSLAREIDAELRRNFHYDYCRQLGQVGELEIVRVSRGAETYVRACQRYGQKLGNVKPTALQKTSGWSSDFETQESMPRRPP